MTLKFNLLKLIFVEMGMCIRVWRSGDSSFTILVLELLSLTMAFFFFFFWIPGWHWIQISSSQSPCLTGITTLNMYKESIWSWVHSLQTNTQEADTDFWVWGQLGLRSELEASQNYTERPCPKLLTVVSVLCRVIEWQGSDIRCHSTNKTLIVFAQLIPCTT